MKPLESIGYFAYALIGTMVALSLIRGAERLADALERPWARFKAWVSAWIGYDEDVLL